ncbi:hypothetical protein DMB66_32705 [Actinoplanes sp. ATCC 53533]|uniref:TVP38/TMEM64 family protein n=1 Tax=Actinoplanes sp. ATCC 53533 TaxID=1288362 RepID=UPI000F77918C|nr:VTT domain-containing protein [Actinoplanes sp. ATCC 53533]RSM56837.1 hypothetical protein DMB66_32705 [Actinoplanes sp. ATCC 53533]
MYVLTGTALAALIAFVAGRVLGRDFVATRSRLSALDACLTTHGAFGVALLRILPIAQFCLVSDGFRTTGIKVGSYLLSTVVGAASGTIVHAVLGASAMSPGSAGFVTSLAAAALPGCGGTAVSAFLWRRRACPMSCPQAASDQITVTAVGPFCALCRSPSPDPPSNLVAGPPSGRMDGAAH